VIDKWPLLPKHDFCNKKINHDDLIILYFPTAGGQFLANVLSCSEDYYGQYYYENLKSVYNNEIKDWISECENLHHELILPLHPRFYTFNKWLSFSKIIYIKFVQTDTQIKWLRVRNKFINNSIKSVEFADLQLKYEYELIDFFKINNKKYYEFSLDCFFNGKHFLNEVKNCCNYYSIKIIDDEIVYNLWKIWMKLNLRLGKES